MRSLPICLGLLLALLSTAQAQDAGDKKALEPGVYAEVRTSAGTMLLSLAYKKAPRTVSNFVGLAEGTKAFKDKTDKWVKRPFYDGLVFHRVIEKFMVQGGCPLGTGSGSPGFAFRDELDRSLTHDAAGVLSMANSDRGKTPWSGTGNTNGSQFFLTLRPTSHLDGLHSVFGRLIKGQDVLKKLGLTETGEQDKPLKPLVIERITILRIGVGKKSIPAAEGAVDKTTIPLLTGAKLQDRVRVEVLCIQFKGCERVKAECDLDQATALELGKRAEAHARLVGADFKALATRFSDVAVREYTLVRKDNDPSFEPAFRLEPGQVSAPIVTPYGVMIVRAR
ncbi:MAG: peptidylprolyl isomerase [Planctomycetes bacterium]|nr:peptidylprolyl isomerase [Planctomycetota bacterium]